MPVSQTSNYVCKPTAIPPLCCNQSLPRGGGLTQRQPVKHHANGSGSEIAMRQVANMIARDVERTSMPHALVETLEVMRHEVSKRMDRDNRARMGQFLTPAPVAMFMAGMFEARKPVLRVLDPGAGIGSLSAAFVIAMCRRARRPQAIAVTAYEIDSVLINHLEKVLDLCRAVSVEAGIQFEARVICEDFLEAGVRSLASDLFIARSDEQFDCAIPESVTSPQKNADFLLKSGA
jgi:adenine-specific DNA-methyltransferase